MIPICLPTGHEIVLSNIAEVGEEILYSIFLIMILIDLFTKQNYNKSAGWGFTNSFTKASPSILQYAKVRVLPCSYCARSKLLLYLLPAHKQITIQPMRICEETFNEQTTVDERRQICAGGGDYVRNNRGEQKIHIKLYIKF